MSRPLAPQPDAEINGMGLRGAVYSNEIAPLTPPAPATPKAPDPVPSMGLDEAVATEIITASLATRPTFEIDVGFAPGDGAEALKTAMTQKLAQTAPAGFTGHYRLRGDVTIAGLNTGKAQVTIGWRLMRPNGLVIGEVRQSGEAVPSEIATYWGSFAKSAVEPAAKGINALIEPRTLTKVGHWGNAS